MKKPSRASTPHFVKEMTEVLIPSREFPQVPYFVYLLEDKDSRRILWKSQNKYNVNSKIHLAQSISTKSFHIGIVGAGATGTGIAAVVLRTGSSATVFIRNKYVVELVRKKIHDLLVPFVGPQRADQLLSSLNITDKLSDLKESDLVIETIDEDIKAKRKLYVALEHYLKKEAVLATNTSSLSIDLLSTALRYPSRFIGMHFFNPITKMKLVEVIGGKRTSPQTIAFTQRVAIALEKQVIIVRKGIEGFIVNRLLFAFLAEAVKVYEENVASKEDIDTAIELGLNHPLGPFKLMDLIGVDLSLEILSNLSHLYRKPAKLQGMRRLVKKGLLGRKTSSGFYEYDKR